jgi:hypothetical protein
MYCASPDLFSLDKSRAAQYINKTKKIQQTQHKKQNGPLNVPVILRLKFLLQS